MGMGHLSAHIVTKYLPITRQLGITSTTVQANVCHICNFAAKNSEAMKKHVSKYHKKFSCKMCDYHCLDNRALTCHIQVKHNTN